MANEVPAAGTGGSPTVTTGAYQTFIDALTAALRQVIGAVPVDTKTIASGTATPTESLTLKIDTESAAATDNLDNLAVTNVAAGRLAVLRAADGSRTVVVRHNQGGSGQFQLKNGVDFTMDDVDKALLVVLEGTDWIELARFHGSDGAALGAFIGLGSGAFLDTGTGGSDLPTVDDILGKKTFTLYASGLVPDGTSGPTGPMFIQRSGTQNPGFNALIFPAGSATFAFGTLTLPKDYGGGALEAKVVWESDDADTGGITWRCTVRAVDDGGDTDVDWSSPSTAADISDTPQGQFKWHETPWVSIGAGGASSGEQEFLFRVWRRGDIDSFTGNGGLVKVLFRYTPNALNDD